MQKFSFFSGLILIPILFSSCASVPMAGLKEDRQGKQFQASPDMGRIYIFRESKFAGGAVKIPVSIDGKIIGQSASGTYFAVDVLPGQHQISCFADSNSEVNITINKGELSFIEHNSTWGALLAGCEVLEVPVAEGQKEVLKLKRAHAKF